MLTFRQFQKLFTGVWIAYKVAGLLAFIETIAIFLGFSLSQDAAMDEIRSRHAGKVLYIPKQTYADALHQNMVKMHLIVWPIALLLIATCVTIYFLWRRNQWNGDDL